MDQSTTLFTRNYRLYRVKDLLNQGAGNISEVAYAVGFNSQSYSSTSYKELFGYPPKQDIGSDN
ncbi:MAG: helix-turn-helix domain-containing protein [Cyclobacteriaceae bacterium]